MPESLPRPHRRGPANGASLDRHAFGLLTLTVAATLATHLGHLPAWLLLPLGAVLGLRWWSRMRRGAHRVAGWVRLPLAGLLLAVVVVHYGNLFGREPGTMLGCGLLVLKLLETERARDARVALGFAGFVLMSALLFRQSLPFTVLICSVLVLLLASLVALQPAMPRGPRAWRGELRVGALLLAASVPLAAVAFVLVPRLASPLWGAPGDGLEARTGLSEDMAPGSMTQLLIDDSPAMRVDFADANPPPPAERYFRAILMWDFDGLTWSRGQGHSGRRPEGVAPLGAEIGYRVTLEPTQGRWLPALDMPLDAPRGAWLTSDRTLFTVQPVTQPRQYRARSATRYRLAEQLDDAARARALALPTGFDPQARALAARWRLQGRDDAGVVQAALDLFNASFTYTLSPPLLGRNAVDEFLFDTRRGYCEHYSSSFVFLMRAAGIPARVVTGYQGGWWNATYGYLLVRQSDAHAWAEVWLDGRGWVRVDPTAAVNPARIEAGAGATAGDPRRAGPAWLRELRNRVDIVNRLWTEGVLHFDALRQRGLLTPFGVVDARAGDLLLALAAALAATLLLATLWALRNSAVPTGDRLDRAWSRFLDRLARRGIRRRHNEGPQALLQRVRAGAPALAAVIAPLVGEYAQLRYAQVQASPANVAALVRRLRRIRLPRGRTGVLPDAASTVSVARAADERGVP
ncbi:transglutaminaseTgpA domain-containing protein [Dokdonella sp.]|uniref:transglutaminase family protein n=1 Tax=Dokdonella sp. TaxID=2291710 RepID=UPI0031C4B669|nr:DUF3488 and transglutaminase-like domain-containing protein [Dokdonella sp.]